MNRFGTKLSKNIFLYHVTGWDKNITFDSKKRRVMVMDATTGDILSDKDLGVDGEMDYEDFLLYAMNIHLDYIDLVNSN